MSVEFHAIHTWEDDAVTPIEEIITPSPPHPHPCLWIVGGTGVGERVSLGEPGRARSVLIGRSPSADVVLDDLGVSRFHASILWDSDGPLLGDHGSTNGTWLGDRQVTSHPLKEGDRFRIGHTVFMFGYAAAGDETSPERKRPVVDGNSRTSEVLRPDPASR
jgi:pSer/pThr/pTyr-binding forkhead associated (FHA) protein